MQSGCVIQEKVARLLSKQHGKPVIKPNKHLALKDEVANRKPKKGGKKKKVQFANSFFFYVCVVVRRSLVVHSVSSDLANLIHVVIVDIKCSKPSEQHQ